MSKTERQEDYPEIKSKIINTARELFVKKGYYHTSMPDIVKSAEVSIGAVYHYFKGKESLAKEIHNYSVQLLEENFSDKILILDTARKRVHAFIKIMFEWTKDDPVLGFVTE